MSEHIAAELAGKSPERLSALRHAALAVLALAGGALAVAAYRIQVGDFYQPASRALASVAVGLAFLAAGGVVWSRRPGNRLGPLMALTAFALLARQLRYSHDPVLFTVFFALGDLSYALVGHSVLAYPSGRLTDRFERAVVAIAYPVVLAFPLAVLLFYDATRPLIQFDPTPRESLLLVSGSADAVELLQKSFVLVFYGGLASVWIVLIARRLWRAPPRTRRVLAPLLFAAVAVALRGIFESVFTFVDAPFARENLFWWQISALIALPLALFAGLLRARLARTTVGDLVLALEQAQPPALRDALARALGDPTLEVGFRLPDRHGYFDAAGDALRLPEAGESREVTPLDPNNEPGAVLVHDSSLLEEPKLVAAAGAAARVALENARLHAEVQAQLADVRESRRRLATAADDERRRIERDLHDGAQQRLVALGLELRSAQRRLGGAAAEDVDRLLATAANELQDAVDELRELAHGVHPSVLTQEGLAAALHSMADRMPLPVSVDAPPGRLSAHIESAAYFVASEALANVVKHAHASRASVSVRETPAAVTVDVVDDGQGGADLSSGTGLQGLADRVEAHGGTLSLESGAGGTRVTAELPLTGA
jgi:signal transduction histidine kinase